MATNGTDRRGLTVIQGGLDNDNVDPSQPRQVLVFPNTIRLVASAEVKDVLEGFIASALFSKVFDYACGKVGDEDKARALLDVILGDLKDDGMSLDEPTAYQDLCLAIDQLADVRDEEE